MKGSNIRVGVIILNYKSEKETIRLYSEIATQKHCDNTLRVIVIDNSISKESKDKLLKSIPEKDIFINPQNNGYAGGNNFGIRLLGLSEFDYFLIVNPDIHITENLISTLVNSIESNPDIAAIGPRICEWKNKDIVYSDGGKIYRNNSGLVKHQNNGHKASLTEAKFDTTIDYVNGSCILLRSETIQKIGMLNEIFFMYFEETEWCSRAKENGWSIAINSHITVYHTPSIKSYLYHYYMARNRILYAKSKRIPLRKIIILQIKTAIYFILKPGQDGKKGFQILFGTFNGWTTRYRLTIVQ